MDGVEPCLFPTLLDENPGGKERRVLVTSSVDLGSGLPLREFCQRHEVTLPNLFHVAWGIVLRIYTGSDSVCFGSLNSGRDVPVSGINDIVGPFINMLVCRMQVVSDAPVLSLVQMNQNQYLESLPYQHYSLADVLHLAGGSNQEETSIRLETVAGYDPTEYDVSVTVAIAEERMEICLSSWTTGLGKQQAEKVAGTFKQVVFEMAQRPYDSAKQLNVSDAGTGGAVRARPDRGAVPRAAGRARRVRVGR
ncbi:hypothetical protein CNMCM8980_008187 [Aspergillus fumigatiaffinis]|nr:hypothetical protein CNMCM8980_008187 [Aspergillus fumigatiaffinis]